MIDRSYPMESQAKLAYANEIDRNPTVEENIDAKIRYHESEIARLNSSKETMAPLLKMRIRDIQQAMSY